MAQPSDRRCSRGLLGEHVFLSHPLSDTAPPALFEPGAPLLRLRSLLACCCSRAMLAGLQGRLQVRPALTGQLAHGPRILEAA